MLAERENCTGCMACINVCPTGSISFVDVEDSLHQYPEIDHNTCVNCGRCESVCTPLHPELLCKEKPYEARYYCAWNKSKEQRRLSTSGGLGSAIVSEALKKGYYVSGVCFDEHWHVEHVVTNDAKISAQFRGSKYLQSDTSRVYKEIKKLVSEGEKVLFIGTPCQITAIKAIMPKTNDRLLTCGIICHGVNAPIVWSDYVTYLQNKRKVSLKSYNFRSKKKGWGKLFIDYEMDNGRKYVEPAWKNLFHVWFGQHYMMRESCFNCPFRKEERYSDLVIGDFWGIEKVLPQLDTKEGVSVLIASTEKGQKFVDSMNSIEIITVDSKRTPLVLKGFLTQKGNNELVNKQIERMHRFSSQYRSVAFVEMVKAYPCPTRWDLLLASIRFHLGIK